MKVDNHLIWRETCSDSSVYCRKTDPFQPEEYRMMQTPTAIYQPKNFISVTSIRETSRLLKEQWTPQERIKRRLIAEKLQLELLRLIDQSSNTQKTKLFSTV